MVNVSINFINVAEDFPLDELAATLEASVHFSGSIWTTLTIFLQKPVFLLDALVEHYLIRINTRSEPTSLFCISYICHKYALPFLK